jgi:hypothetical protein
MPSYSPLCERKEPLSKEERHRLGVDGVLLIHQVRECMRELQQAQSRLVLITSVLEERLGEDDGMNEAERVMAPNISEVSEGYS